MAEVTVDKLRVEVEATAKGANQVFQELENRLKALKSSATGFNTSGLTNLTNALNKVATSLDNISSKINTVNNTTATPKVNTSGVTSSEKKIDSSISKIRESLAGLTAYGNAAMSGDSSALTSFDRRVTSIQSAIDVLKSRLDSLGDTTIKVNAIDYYESKIEKAKDAIDQLVAKENEFKANGTDTGEAWDTLQAKLAETRDQLDALIQRQSEFSAGDMIDVDAFEEQRAAIADFQSQLDSASDTVHNAVANMNGQPVDIDTQPSQVNLADLIASLNTVSSKLLSVVGSSIIGGFSKLSSSIKSVKNSISSLKSKVSGLSSTFNKGFFTILKYGFGIRSLYVLFRRLRQAVKDSFTELQNSGAYYETTRANIEALKSSLSILKYQFGAAFETIFNTVAPALQTFINYLISAMNTLSAFIAKLTGKSTYSKAVKATSDIAGNAGSAADSAKEMAKQLQGFDELNNMSGNSSGGSGSGGGSSGDSSGVTYVTENVDNALGSFTKALSDSINKGEWEQVGSLISEKLTEMMNNIPWDTIFSKAKNFGKNLASFLNGLITEDLFSALGTSIGNAIKTALTFLDSFGETYSWTKFGDSIASGINSFVKTNPLSLAIDTFNKWANGILDTLNNAIKGISWVTIGQHIADAIGKVDAWSITWKLGTLVNNLVNAIYDIAKNKQTWKNLGQKIADGINGFFEGFNGSDLAKAANAIADGLWTALGTAVKNIKWYKIADDIISTIGNLDIGTISLIATVGFAPAALAAIKTGITTLLATEVAAMGGVSVGTIAVAAVASLAIGWKIGNKIYEKATGTEVQGGMIDQIKEAFSGLFGKDKIQFNLGDFISFTFGESNPWNDYFSTLGDEAFYLTTEIKAKLAQLGKNIVEGIITGFKAAMDFKATVKELFDKIVAKIKEIFGINSPAKNMEPYGNYIFQGIVTGFTNKFSELETAIKGLKTKIDTWFKTYITNAVSFVVNVGANFITSVSTMKSYAGNFKRYITSVWKSKTAKIKATLLTGVKTLQSWGGSFKKYITDKWNSKTATMSIALGGVVSTISDIKDNLKATFMDLYNNWKSESASFSISIKGIALTTLSSWAEKIKTLYENWVGKDATFSLQFSAAAEDLRSWVDTNVLGKVRTVFSKVPILKNFASQITLYAEGGIAKKATNAIIGEAGTEAVVPLERNTGWLKKISNMLIDGMSKVSQLRYNPYTPSLSFAGAPGFSFDDSSSRDSNTAIMEQNRLLAEQNELLRQIANKNVTISSRDVFKATQTEANNFYNRTGNSPFLY